MASNMSEDLRSGALVYHQYPKPGKLEIRATKPLANGRDLSRAYSPGVAAACEAIVSDPDSALDYTARGNLVGVLAGALLIGDLPLPSGLKADQEQVMVLNDIALKN